jgi:hypothetical protein
MTGNDIPTLPDRHAFRHKMAADGRESLTHMLVFPEHGIAGFIYPTVRANGLAKCRVTLFGPAIEGIVQEEAESLVPDDMDFDNWRVDGLFMAIREPHRVIDIRWDGPRIQFDGRYEAMHPAYAFSSHPLGNPPYYGDDRTEQHGRVTAKLVVDRTDREVEGFLIHDHSWGPRVWGLNQHYKWFHATTESCSVHFFEMFSYGRRHLRGYLLKDGVMRHISDVRYDFKFDDQMMHKTIDAEIFDADGRIVLIKSRAYANMQLDLDPKVYLNEAALQLEIDGESGTGWCEFCWSRDYLDFAKQYVSRFG